MEQGHRRDEREHVASALGRRRRIGRIKALNRLGDEIGLGQQTWRSARELLSRKRDVFPWPNTALRRVESSLVVTLPRA